MELGGKVCVVTGGARGLGLALAQRFAAEGAAGVVIADLDGEGAVAAAAALPVPALGLRADVGVADEVHGIVDRTKEWFGRVDLFCSNAVAAPAGGGLEVSDDDWDRAWAVNVMAHLHAAQACVPSMLDQGSGYLVPVSSGAGLLAYVHSAPYTVTKHAVVSLAEWLAITYGGRGIRVSCVCPGGILTDALAASLAAGYQPTMPTAAISPAEAADRIVEGLRAERFLIVTHPELSEWEAFKVADRDRWIRGMRKVQARSAPVPAPAPGPSPGSPGPDGPA
jgi:NAD(P)-dependent dehydrogenase (short-subunit alcohol dehydrogenase family)